MLVQIPERIRRAIYREVARGLVVSPATKLSVHKVAGNAYLNYDVYTGQPIAPERLKKIQAAITKGLAQSGAGTEFKNAGQN